MSENESLERQMIDSLLDPATKILIEDATCMIFNDDPDLGGTSLANGHAVLLHLAELWQIVL